MMEYATFHAIGNIGAALTGFIGIVIALQHKSGLLTRLATVTILGTSVGATLFSFLPELFGGFLLPELAWRLACGVFGFYHLFLIIYHQVKQRSIQANTPVQWLITIASFPVVFLKIGVGFGFLIPYAYSIYMLGLLWLVGVAAYLFALTLFGVLGHGEQKL